jgi:cell division protein FtsI/penicillin-binding protein 2
MNAELHMKRMRALSGLLVLLFVGLAVRLIQLQHFDHEEASILAARRTQRTFLHQPRRGDIVDRNGNPLASCIPVKKVFADPSFVQGYYPQVAEQLAPLLGYDRQELADRLKPTTYLNKRGQLMTNQYLNLQREVSVEQWEQIRQVVETMRFHPPEHRLTTSERQYYRAFRRYAIYAEDDYQRVYRSGHLASHVIGFAQKSEEEFNRALIASMEGKEGIEAQFDDQLRGLPGWRVTETDGLQREVVVHREEEVEPRPGHNVVLTLDLLIQKIVEDELAVAMRENRAASVSSVVVRPRTGEILAMATLPDFDPNAPGQAEAACRRNRVLTDQMEPGSTFKIVSVGAALDTGVIGLSDVFDCENGAWVYRGRTLRDHEAYGDLTVEEILMKSSNIGAAKIALRMGADHLYEAMKRFGFGSRTGIALGGEVVGMVRPPAQWDGLMITRIPMGQAVAVTHLQMVMAMSAIANEGLLMRPLLVSGLREPNGDTFVDYEPQPVRQVMSEYCARQMVDVLKRVVSKEGTAQLAQLDHYTVAGKTGTAEKPGRGGYLPGKYIASFIGFFPADRPEVCISVVIDEPQGGYYGGRKAAPVFRRIAEQLAQYLKIRPDRESEQTDKMTGVPGQSRWQTAASGARTALD